MKIIAFVLAFAACSKTNEVTLLLGPDEDRLSRGFVCRRVADPHPFLMQDVFAGGKLRFALVVDVLELDPEGVFPGCRGEELFAYCAEHDCGRNVQRTCVPDVELEFPAMFDPSDPVQTKALVAKFRDALGHRTLLRDAPNAPVIVRVVAMPACPTATRLDDTDALGCAYSCPVQLDEVSGSIAISLDTFDDNCEREVRACTSFPFGPTPL